MAKSEFQFFIEQDKSNPCVYHFNPFTWYYEFILDKKTFDGILNDKSEVIDNLKTNTLHLECSLLDLLLSYHDCHNQYIKYYWDGGLYEYVYKDKTIICGDSQEVKDILKENMHKIVNFVLNQDNNIILKDKSFNTPSKVEECIKYVLAPRNIFKYIYENGKGSDFEPLTPCIDLVSAAEINAFNVVKYFVEKGLDPNIIFYSGWHEPSPSALYCAIQNNNFQMVKYLIENGASIYIGKDYKIEHDDDEHDEEDESSYCHYEDEYEENIECENFEIISYLLEKNMIAKFSNLRDKYDEIIKIKSKERSLLLIEDLLSKYHSPENIEK